MRNRATGILFVLSGVFFVAGVLDPPILPTWGGSATEVMATASAHRAAWFASTWLITLSIVTGLAAVELLTRTLGTGLARVGRSLYLAGSALGLASTTYDLSVTSTLLGAPRLPGWYSGIQHWADGLGTAYFALLAPAAMGCIAVAILRTRAMPRWTGYVFLIATVLLLGQYAAFRGALPFPQFLAFIAIGIAALAHRAPGAPWRPGSGRAGCRARSPQGLISAADPARVPDSPQSAPAAPLPTRRRAAETATRTGQPGPMPRPKTGSRRRPGRVAGGLSMRRM